MSEEIEVKVRQIEGEGNGGSGTDSTPMDELLRRLLLASLGAVALTYDEAEKMVNRLVERGELAQKDGEKILTEVMGFFRQRDQITQQASSISGQIESGLEQLLGTFNIPTKHDIDELSSKIAELAARVEELRRSKS